MAIQWTIRDSSWLVLPSNQTLIPYQYAGLTDETSSRIVYSY